MLCCSLALASPSSRVLIFFDFEGEGSRSHSSHIHPTTLHRSGVLFLFLLFFRSTKIIPRLMLVWNWRWWDFSPPGEDMKEAFDALQDPGNTFLPEEDLSLDSTLADGIGDRRLGVQAEDKGRSLACKKSGEYAKAVQPPPDHTWSEWLAKQPVACQELGEHQARLFEPGGRLEYNGWQDGWPDLLSSRDGWLELSIWQDSQPQSSDWLARQPKSKGRWNKHRVKQRCPSRRQDLATVRKAVMQLLASVRRPLTLLMVMKSPQLVRSLPWLTSVVSMRKSMRSWQRRPLQG